MKHVAQVIAPVFGVFIGRGVAESSWELIVVSSLAAAFAIGVWLSGHLKESKND